PINDNQWHQIVVTRDAVSGNVQVFVDGILSNANVSQTGAKTTPFSYIGRLKDTNPARDATNQHYYSGLLDEVSIDNSVLSATKVRAHYQAAQGVSITVTNVRPTVNAGADATIDTTGQFFVSSGSFTDPGSADTWTATVNYGDGPDVPLSLNP